MIDHNPPIAPTTTRDPWITIVGTCRTKRRAAYHAEGLIVAHHRFGAMCRAQLTTSGSSWAYRVRAKMPPCPGATEHLAALGGAATEFVLREELTGNRQNIAALEVPEADTRHLPEGWKPYDEIEEEMIGLARFHWQTVASMAETLMASGMLSEREVKRLCHGVEISYTREQQAIRRHDEMQEDEDYADADY